MKSLSRVLHCDKGKENNSLRKGYILTRELCVYIFEDGWFYNVSLFEKDLYKVMPCSMCRTWGGRGWAKLPKLKSNKTYYNTLSWPQNAGNPFSENLNFNNFRAENAPGCPRTSLPLRQSVPSLKSVIRPSQNPFLIEFALFLFQTYFQIRAIKMIMIFLSRWWLSLRSVE